MTGPAIAMHEDEDTRTARAIYDSLGRVGQILANSAAKKAGMSTAEYLLKGDSSRLLARRRAIRARNH